MIIMESEFGIVNLTYNTNPVEETSIYNTFANLNSLADNILV